MTVEKKAVPNKKKKDEAKKPEMSEEDKKLQEDLAMVIERLKDDNPNLWNPALQALKSEIRQSTTSMTSVPKPLKFLKPYFDSLKEIYEKIEDVMTKKLCADIISVLAMTNAEGRESLKYRLLGTPGGLVDWGHEYVRHISGEIVGEWDEIPEVPESEEQKKVLIELTKQIAPYQMKLNAEAEACDLLMEIERLDMLEQYVDESVYQRVCLYLTSCVPYVPAPENTNLLLCALKLYRKFGQAPHAMRLAMQLNDKKLIEDIFNSCSDWSMKKQLAFMMGRQNTVVQLNDDEDDRNEDLVEIMSNTQLNANFLSLARELDIMEPKTPEDIYKSHLENSRPSYASAQVDSARQNLASSFVNGFVNAGFGKDKLLLCEDGSKAIYKNKEHGMFSTTASLGLLLLWDLDGGLTQIDRFMYSSDENLKAGALLACGIVSCGVKNDCDPAWALLSDYVLNDKPTVRIGSIFGLGLAYSGTDRLDITSHLCTVLSDPKSSNEVIGVTALSLGMIAVGTCNTDVTQALLLTLMEMKETREASLKEPFAKFLPLGLGLCFLGKQEEAEATIAALEGLPEPFHSMASTLIDVCAYAGTGNVLKIQQLQHICSEHYEPEEKNKENKKEKKEKEEAKDDKADMSMQQAVATLGLGLIAMGEDIGSDMAYRSFGLLLRYSELAIRRVVPLALGLLYVSNPKLNAIDTLSKFSHDADPEVAYNAILAMGLLGAGTNHARLGTMLRQLAQYHAKDANHLFMVRIAQGLVHMGKGTLTLSPYHSDRQLMRPVAVAGLLGLLVACIDVKQTILGKSHYLFYSVAAAIQPRMLVTFDEELKALPVSVRVGTAVDVVGQAGKPKTITGFQTHTTPVLLSHGERAELATDEYLPLTPVLEGFVILRKNPYFEK